MYCRYQKSSQIRLTLSPIIVGWQTLYLAYNFRHCLGNHLNYYYHQDSQKNIQLAVEKNSLEQASDQESHQK